MHVYHFEGVPRSPLGVAIKNVLTFGIYTKVWLYRINREMDGHEGFHIDLRWLAVMVALPIVTPIIVKFQTARRLNQMTSHQVTLPVIRARRLGWISIVPVLGSGFYAWWVQASLNRHWFHHRREERMALARDRIERIKAEAETEATVEKREALQAQVQEMQTQVDEELEAARIKLGEERFAERMKRAKLHAAQGGRMSRKDLQRLREEEKRHRKEAKARRKAERGPLFGLLPKKADATADPDDDAAWRPKTPKPDRTPDEIRAVAEREGRAPTDEEAKEIKAAEKLIAKREKEEESLAKAREKARSAREKAAAKREKDEEKARLKAEGAKAKDEAKGEGKPKKEKAKKKPGKATKEPKKGKTKKGKEPVEKIAVQPRRVRAPDTVVEVGSGPLRVMTIACPRCKTQIEGVQKRGDAPAKVTCPTCGLIGKV